MKINLYAISCGIHNVEDIIDSVETLNAYHAALSGSGSSTLLEIPIAIPTEPIYDSHAWCNYVILSAPRLGRTEQIRNVPFRSSGMQCIIGLLQPGTG